MCAACSFSFLRSLNEHFLIFKGKYLCLVLFVFFFFFEIKKIKRQSEWNSSNWNSINFDPIVKIQSWILRKMHFSFLEGFIKFLSQLFQWALELVQYKLCKISTFWRFRHVDYIAQDVQSEANLANLDKNTDCHSNWCRLHQETNTCTQPLRALEINIEMHKFQYH